MTPKPRPDLSELSRELSPLGVPTVVTADDPALLAAACAHFAGCEGRSDGPALSLRLTLSDTPDDDAPLDIRVAGPRLVLTGRGIVGEADARRGEAECRAPSRLIDDPAGMAEVIDTLLLFLLARSGRTPVHAAGIMLGEMVLVLAGPSGSGKSTLALAAAGRGLQILSDDTLYIQLRPRTRVWGLRRPVHVFPQDGPRFTAATRLRGGKLKAAIALPPAAHGPPYAERAELILLERGERLALAPIDAEAAVAGLSRLEPGFDLLADESAAVARALAEGGGWRLTLARDPVAAIDFLCERLAAHGTP